MMVQRQRGVALLIALLVVALATLLIAAFLDAGELSMARTRNQLRAGQANAYARGLEAYAAQVLMVDDRQGAVDTNADAWAMPLPPTPVPGGTIQATMQDLNGCFNINNLYQHGRPQKLWIERFQRLLENLKLSPAIADAAVDWIDEDRKPRDRGAEDHAYTGRTPPYLTANRKFADASGLRLVRGVDTRAWRKLRSWVCALPTPTVLNINTASIPVLMSLSDGMTEQLAARLHQDGHAHWRDAQRALRELGPAGIAACPPEGACGVGTRSDYFRARAVIELDGIDYVHTSVLQRRAGVRVIRRAPGGS